VTCASARAAKQDAIDAQALLHQMDINTRSTLLCQPSVQLAVVLALTVDKAPPAVKGAGTSILMLDIYDDAFAALSARLSRESIGAACLEVLRSHAAGKDSWRLQLLLRTFRRLTLHPGICSQFNNFQWLTECLGLLGHDCDNVRASAMESIQMLMASAFNTVESSTLLEGALWHADMLQTLLDTTCTAQGSLLKNCMSVLSALSGGRACTRRAILQHDRVMGLLVQMLSPKEANGNSFDIKEGTHQALIILQVCLPCVWPSRMLHQAGGLSRCICTCLQMLPNGVRQ
jgi:hypothetical protein